MICRKCADVVEEHSSQLCVHCKDELIKYYERRIKELQSEI